MPFDGSHVGLSQRLAWTGVVPVPDAFLEAHKAAEVAKHPDRQGQILLAMMFGVAVVAVVLATILVGYNPALALPTRVTATCLMAMPLFVMLFVSFATIFQGVKVKGPARWRETFLTDQYVPEPIKSIAVEARRQVPGSYLVIGELIQKEVVLDPYLLLCTGNERVCLGIWDGETIIAQAA